MQKGHWKSTGLNGIVLNHSNIYFDYSFVIPIYIKM